MHKRLMLAWLLVAALCLPLLACADASYDAVLDTSADGGLLTARFLRLHPTAESDDKGGDSTILQSPDGLIMVIDAGEPTCGPQVVAALETMGVTRVDFLVASHPHVDHVGGFPAVMARFEIGAVYTSAVDYASSSYYRAYEAEIAARGIPHVILSEGDTFAFGEYVQADVLHPGKDIEYYAAYPDNSTQFINNLSMVLKLTYGESTILFAGDLYTGGEKIVMEKAGEALSADVMKINHHGAVTSSSKGWRDAVSPRIAVAIHDAVADMKTLQKYERDGIDTYLTFIDGNVKVSTAGDGEWAVLSEAGREGNLFD